MHYTVNSFVTNWLKATPGNNLLDEKQKKNFILFDTETLFKMDYFYTETNSVSFIGNVPHKSQNLKYYK